MKGYKIKNINLIFIGLLITAVFAGDVYAAYPTVVTDTYVNKVVENLATKTELETGLAKKVNTTVTTTDSKTTETSVVSGVAVDKDGNIVVTKSNVSSGEIADKSITNAKLADNSVDSVKIKDGSITRDDLNSSVLSDYVNNHNLDIKLNEKMNAKISGNDGTGAAIIGLSVVDGGLVVERGDISTEKMGEGSVTTVEIKDGTITKDDINPELLKEYATVSELESGLATKLPSVLDSEGVADGEMVTDVQIIDGVLTVFKGNSVIGDDTITGKQIIDGSITADDLDSTVFTTFVGKDQYAAEVDSKMQKDVVYEGTGNFVTEVALDATTGLLTVFKNENDVVLPADTVTETTIKDYAIIESKLADGSVTTPKIANENVTTEKLADSSVTTEKIADFSIVTDKFAVGAVDSNAIMDGTIKSIDLDSEVLADYVTQSLLSEGLFGTIKKSVTFVTEEGVDKPNVVSSIEVDDDGNMTVNLGYIEGASTDSGNPLDVGSVTTREIANETILIEDLNAEVKKLFDGKMNTYIAKSGSGNVVSDIRVDSEGNMTLVMASITGGTGGTGGDGSFVLAEGVVTGFHIKDKTIQSVDIEEGGITTDEIRDRTIMPIDLNESVYDWIAMLLDGKLGSDITVSAEQGEPSNKAITDIAIVDGEMVVTISEITGTGTGGELGNDSVTTKEIKNYTILTEDLDPSVLRNYATMSDLSEFITQADLSAYVTNTKFDAEMAKKVTKSIDFGGTTGGVITSIDFASDGGLIVTKGDVESKDFVLEDNSVTRSKIVDDAVNGDKIEEKSITENHLSDELYATINSKMDMPPECTENPNVYCVLTGLPGQEMVWTRIYTDSSGN